ncbi:MAG: DNA recombination protein RmuC [candidate division WOR-3 bacterium]|nr:DNA recombination protein RmuC [candidate division WOR-3 bacterium]MCX7837413.1 DNA recombination protein RmuC [candidate division WOR-3 bacterium]MDW8113803.1 DNA recombination protein RmuC [candidate division WOR-3 bacterium]
MVLGIIAIILLIIAFIFLYLKIEELKKSEPIRLLQEQISQLRIELSQNLQNTSGQINLRLDKATEVISDVKERLGGLSEAQKRVIELSEDIKRLEDLLKPPKFRGALGETLLENLLSQILPKENYEVQYSFKTGSKVDAIIKIGDKIVPIDAKFPLESFEKMISAEDKEKYESAKRDFIKTCKQYIDEITKYILPTEGTFDFALMYIPAENIYYETILNSEIFNYSLTKKVIPVSPNTFYAYLIVILYGLRGLKIEEKAKEIISGLQKIEKDVKEVREEFNTARNHLRNSFNKFDELDKKLSQLERSITLIK